jgi:hypothetical protein
VRFWLLAQPAKFNQQLSDCFLMDIVALATSEAGIGFDADLGADDTSNHRLGVGGNDLREELVCLLLTAREEQWFE